LISKKGGGLQENKWRHHHSAQIPRNLSILEKVTVFPTAKNNSIIA
jgi:hypothetical protein